MVDGVVGDPDRPRGILSEADRRYLLDPEGYAEDYSPQAVSTRRLEIPERFHNAILDFGLLWEFWDPAEREEAFSAEAGSPFENSLVDLFAILYLETYVSHAPPFPNLWSRAARKVADHLAGPHETFAIHVEPPIAEFYQPTDMEQALEKFGRGQRGLRDMTDEEARVLLHLLQYDGRSVADFQRARNRLYDRVGMYTEKNKEAAEAIRKNSREK